MKTHLYARDHVASIVRHVGLDTLMDETIEGIARACADVAAGHFEVPARAGFVYEQPATGLLEWMPAMRLGERIVIKLVGYHPDNPDRQRLPTILSSILVFDPTSGHLSGVMDGTFLTALRTGAASALATRVLKARDASRVGLVGAGAQAVTQLHALTRVMDVERVHVFDIDPATAASFADRVDMLGLDDSALIAGDVEAAARCDVVCTATSVAVGAGPVVPDAALGDCVHVNAVGADFPGKTELPRTFLSRALVCPDFPEQALAEGECQSLTREDMGPDLVALVAAPDAAWRDRPTVFDSTGWALEDYVVAELIARHGQALGIGDAIELESLAGDPKDPYGFLLEAVEGRGLRAAGG